MSSMTTRSKRRRLPQRPVFDPEYVSSPQRRREYSPPVPDACLDIWSSPTKYKIDVKKASPVIIGTPTQGGERTRPLTPRSLGRIQSVVERLRTCDDLDLSAHSLIPRRNLKDTFKKTSNIHTPSLPDEESSDTDEEGPSLVLTNDPLPLLRELGRMPEEPKPSLADIACITPIEQIQQPAKYEDMQEATESLDPIDLRCPSKMIEQEDLEITVPTRIQARWQRIGKRRSGLLILKESSALNWVIDGLDNDPRKRGIGDWRARQLERKLNGCACKGKILANKWHVK
ncbi:hypothetical protein DFQ28_005010 [Apophysomyces sp. BC1034]|nr:hypothetical protein DFQ30_000582 [Apophysomyces sp. BC1015]KAG0180303.1 hypothetical protein DFQ29_000922 [Apophysomyces sp. BC1021]KAG0194798.1 hypothetical protein DFQ28_005010 [Apophysomyces sp. BC1034]